MALQGPQSKRLRRGPKLPPPPKKKNQGRWCLIYFILTTSGYSLIPTFFPAGHEPGGDLWSSVVTTLSVVAQRRSSVQFVGGTWLINQGQEAVILAVSRLIHLPDFLVKKSGSWTCGAPQLDHDLFAPCVCHCSCSDSAKCLPIKVAVNRLFRSPQRFRLIPLRVVKL